METDKLEGYSTVTGNFTVPWNYTFCNLSKIDVQEQLGPFWKIEEVSNTKQSVYSVEENSCEELSVKNFYREGDGRFVIKLSLKKPILGQTRDIALKRMKSAEKRLQNNSYLNTEYSKFIEDYCKLGHMSLANEFLKSEGKFILSHHCVLKSSSLIIKLRVVFDGSYKSINNISLNDILMVGPFIQPDIFNTLLRFRKHQITFKADIEKMYRQIKLHPSDRQFQHILWREDKHKLVQEYELDTVTYGLDPSSFKV
ncbi:uncharacterized protein LOC130451899 [Diorhabda sublineata]|uniref:uncharacterized protein LOC130451899 n=1 Tax=Diorhabda sublineata TaxID=1163346 RepID=UPI0024E16C89|nr:uncharacterized protein LOC130451899 [Diorhabda sublineata]